MLTKLRGPAITDNEVERVVSLDGRGTSLWFYEQCVRMCSSGGYGVSLSSRALDLALSLLRHLACPTAEDDSGLFNNLDDEGMTPAEGDDEEIWVEYLDSLYKIVASSKTIKAVCTAESIIHAASLAHTNMTARTLTFLPTRDPDDGDTGASTMVVAAQCPENRDSATGAREAGLCFADSSSSTRELRSNGQERVNQSTVVRDNQANQPTVGEKRSASDVKASDNTSGETPSKRQKKNQARAGRRKYGSKIIPNANPSLITESSRYGRGRSNDRSCLRDAVVAHLKDCPSVKAISSALQQIEPTEGDTSVEEADIALRKHGWKLVQVSKEFFDGPRHYNLLQVKLESKRKLLIGLELYLSNSSVPASHFVGWDGSVIHDRPNSIRVNNSSDRTPRLSKEVFERLYPKSQFSHWRIVSAYELVHLRLD